jgi:hypothetical protein
MSSVDGLAWPSGRPSPRQSPSSLTRSRRPSSAGHRTSVACAGIGGTEPATKPSRTAGGGRTHGVARHGSPPFSQLARSQQSQIRRPSIPCRLQLTSRSSRRPCRTTAPRGNSRPARNVQVAAHARRSRVALPQLPRQPSSRIARRRVEAKAAGSALAKRRLGSGAELDPSSPRVVRSRPIPP